MNLFKTKCFMLAFALATTNLLLGHTIISSFKITKLVSDIEGEAAHTDSNLVNPWGLTFDSKGKLVIANQDTDLVTSYKKSGSHAEVVTNAESLPTGIESNPFKKGFQITSGVNAYPATYLLATEEGTILAYNKHINGNDAVIVADRSAAGAIYTGLTTGHIHHNHFLYAADFSNGFIDIFDDNFTYISSFTDLTVPTGYAPFNIRNIRGLLYVTFAKQVLAGGGVDVPGIGHGFVDVFALDGTLISRLVSQGLLNSPYGLAIAPEDFGDLGGTLLVGNSGDGAINAYDPVSGELVSQLKDRNGHIISINGLKSLKFPLSSHSHKAVKPEDAELFFTAGINGGVNGLVGRITATKPHIATETCSE